MEIVYEVSRFYSKPNRVQTILVFILMGKLLILVEYFRGQLNTRMTELATASFPNDCWKYWFYLRIKFTKTVLALLLIHYEYYKKYCLIRYIANLR